MEDTKEIFAFVIIAFLLEYFKYEFNLSILNIIIFINLVGLYYISKKIKFTMKIEYNKD
tara:strand:- start:229 stop:405 length:177 start_codon:yes stop_codon:yes gene_type:complete